jgi:large conductance mechanosensitive channel
MPMKAAPKVLKEFQGFALKGNVIDLAVAVILGGAFGKVVDALVKNILMPLLSYVTPGPGNYRAWHVGKLEVGAFLSELINFTIIAAALFLVLKKLAGAVRKVAGLGPEEPTTRECPYCLSAIPARASRCAHCTSELPAAG